MSVAWGKHSLVAKLGRMSEPTSYDSRGAILHSYQT